MIRLSATAAIPSNNVYNTLVMEWMKYNVALFKGQAAWWTAFAFITIYNYILILAGL